MVMIFIGEWVNIIVSVIIFSRVMIYLFQSHDIVANDSFKLCFPVEVVCWWENLVVKNLYLATIMFP